ncbi:MAG TPA: hypothetical protein VGG98_00940 [Solirubrobacteraceae bacterium]
MSDWTNKGIIGNVNDVGNLVVGDSAKIEVTTVEQPVMDKLQALTRAVEAYDGPADTRMELLAANRQVLDELNAAEPDKSKILSRLSEITRIAGSATTIAGAVTALASAVQLVL